ncbi:hypothetical protein [Yaniella sp.]|nr:hypothetical protein [Yaniella sp.]
MIVQSSGAMPGYLATLTLGLVPSDSAPVQDVPERTVIPALTH